MPASFMLILVLLKWSVPVLYVVLFFPDLKQVVGSEARSSLSRQGSEYDMASNGLSFEYLLPMVAAATTALMFGLFVGASWAVCLMLVGAGAALVGGVAYTVLQMHHLGLTDEAERIKASLLRIWPHLSLRNWMFR